MSIASLLQLQDHDQLLENSRRQLNEIPLQMAVLEKKIKQEKKAIQERDESHKQIEIKHRELEQQIKSADEKIKRYQQQQHSLQKQDACQAIEQEIALLRNAIDNDENEVLDLLTKIEESEKENAQNNAQSLKEIEKWSEQINHLHLNEKKCQKEVTQQENDYNQMSQNIDDAWVKIYERVKQSVKRFPYVVLLENQRCSGCHLRVSKEVLEETILAKKIVYCDQCRRIVFMKNTKPISGK